MPGCAGAAPRARSSRTRTPPPRRAALGSLSALPPPWSPLVHLLPLPKFTRGVRQPRTRLWPAAQVAADVGDALLVSPDDSAKMFYEAEARFQKVPGCQAVPAVCVGGCPQTWLRVEQLCCSPHDELIMHGDTPPTRPAHAVPGRPACGEGPLLLGRPPGSAAQKCCGGHGVRLSSCVSGPTRSHYSLRAHPVQHSAKAADQALASSRACLRPCASAALLSCTLQPAWAGGGAVLPQRGCARAPQVLTSCAAPVRMRVCAAGADQPRGRAGAPVPGL